MMFRSVGTVSPEINIEQSNVSCVQSISGFQSGYLFRVVPDGTLPCGTSSHNVSFDRSVAPSEANSPEGIIWCVLFKILFFKTIQ
jgi:hypothetical protein